MAIKKMANDDGHTIPDYIVVCNNIFIIYNLGSLLLVQVSCSISHQVNVVVCIESLEFLITASTLRSIGIFLPIVAGRVGSYVFAQTTQYNIQYSEASS